MISGIFKCKPRVRLWVMNEGEDRRITVRFQLSHIACSKQEFIEAIGNGLYVEGQQESSNQKGLCWHTEIISNANSIEEPLTAMTERLRPGFEDIARICEEQKAEAVFVIRVRAQYIASPILEITPQLCHFFNQLRAKVELDYDYWW